MTITIRIIGIGVLLWLVNRLLVGHGESGQR